MRAVPPGARNRGSVSDTVGMRMSSRTVVVLAAAVAVVASSVSLAPSGLAGPPPPSERPSAERPGARSTVLIAAGDMTCDPAHLTTSDPRKCQERVVSRMVVRAVRRGADGFLALGDLQYEKGALSAFRTEYDRTFGRVKRVTHPVPGNHEYFTPHASGYFTYFGRRAGTPSRPWRSYVPRPGWRVVLLDSQCDEVGGCGPKSRQGRWFAALLRRTPERCVIATWHYPLHSSGPHGMDPDTRRAAQQLWSIADRGGVDVVLNGHDHLMERFAKLDGMRQFISGAGGRSLYYVKYHLAITRFVDAKHFGVLRLQLLPRRYQWQFVAVGGKVLDSGSSRCSNPRA